MKKFLITALLLMLLFPMLAMSKEASVWYLGAKSRIFNEIDSLISSKGIIDEKSAFNLQLLDGNITGDGVVYL